MFNVEIRVETGKSFEVVNRPLASNIIRDDDIVDGETF
jgi:hypothetical protein